MLQETHTNSVLPNTPTEAATPPRRSPESSQFSADVSAGRLMDDLFQEVEQLLGLEVESSDAALNHPNPAPALNETQTAPPPLTSHAETLAIQPFNSLAQQGLAEQRLAEQNLATLANTDLAATAIADPIISTQTNAPKGQWNRLLLTVGCASIVVSLALWLLYQDGRQHQQAMVAGTTGAVASVADQQFADYVQHSLLNIDQQAQSVAGSAQSATSKTSTPGMPTVVMPKAPSPLASTQLPTSSGKEYVPVYQLPSNLYPSGTPIAPLPNLPGAKLPNPGKSNGAIGTKTATTGTTGISQKLVGVLDQGNNSVALFEINGITQRYEIGESIGSSGWTLVEVSKNQAIIRRNGDVRSLFVGHSF